MREIESEDKEKKARFGVKMSDLTARQEEKEGKLFWDVVRLFTKWANVNIYEGGSPLPDLQLFRKTIALGQTFEWHRTGTDYKLVIARDHQKLSKDHFDKIEVFVFFFAEVNFRENDKNKKAYKLAREEAEKFDVLVENFLINKKVAEELRAYEFRRKCG